MCIRDRYYMADLVVGGRGCRLYFLWYLWCFFGFKSHFNYIFWICRNILWFWPLLTLRNGFWPLANDHSSWYFDILGHLEVIWPRYDPECDLRWPPWPQKLKLLESKQVIYLMKANDASSWYLHIKKHLKVIRPQYDKKKWPRYDLHGHKNQSYLNHTEWYI